MADEQESWDQYRKLVVEALKEFREEFKELRRFVSASQANTAAIETMNKLIEAHARTLEEHNRYIDEQRGGWRWIVAAIATAAGIGGIIGKIWK